MMYFFENYRLIDYAGFISTVMWCVVGKEWQLVGLKTVGKTLNRPCCFILSETEAGKTDGKQNRYYGISGTEHIGREHVDYDRESVTQDGNTIHVTTQNI